MPYWTNKISPWPPLAPFEWDDRLSLRSLLSARVCLWQHLGNIDNSALKVRVHHYWRVSIYLASPFAPQLSKAKSVSNRSARTFFNFLSLKNSSTTTSSSYRTSLFLLLLLNLAHFCHGFLYFLLFVKSSPVVFELYFHAHFTHFGQKLDWWCGS